MKQTVRNLLLLLLVMPGLAFAYVGPGAGISAIGSFLALIMVVVVAVFGFFWYPIKRLLKGKQQAVIEDDADAGSDAAEQGDDAIQKNETAKHD